VKVRSRPIAGLLAVSVLMAAVAGMGFIAAAPFVRLNALEQRIAQNQGELLQLRKAMAREGELRKENRELAAAGKGANVLLLEGKTTGIAGANLQKLVSGLVLEHGGTASSFQILPPKEDGNLMRIPMSLSISVGIDGLRDILHRLETGTPLIFVDDITIRAEQNTFQLPDPHFLGQLDVTLQVSGFALKNEAS
jgi:general secretion pathway protein M